MSFVAGGFTVTYGGLTVGQIAAGVTLEHIVNKELIRGDNKGQTPQDAVYQGEEFFADMTLMEYDQGGAVDAFWPYNATFGTLGTIGVLDVQSSLVKALVLTDIAGTPAETKPASLTASRSILPEGFPVRMLFAPALRAIPLRQRFYLDATDRFFVLT